MSAESRKEETGNAFALVPDHVSAAELPGGETALLDLESGYYFHLNEVGAAIFRLIQERSDLEGVVNGLMNEYEEVDRDKLRADVEGLVNDLIAAELVMAN